MPVPEVFAGPFTFHERDRGHTSSCEKITGSRVRFARMTANSGVVKATSWRAHREKAVSECPELVWFEDHADGYSSGVHVPRPGIGRAPDGGGELQSPNWFRAISSGLRYSTPSLQLSERSRAVMVVLPAPFGPATTSRTGFNEQP